MTKENRNARLEKGIKSLKATLKGIDKAFLATSPSTEENGWYASERILDAKEDIEAAIENLQEALNRLTK